MSERKVIGFVGVGVMGNPISKHLIALGHDVLVYDKSEAAVKAITGIYKSGLEGIKKVAEGK